MGKGVFLRKKKQFSKAASLIMVIAMVLSFMSAMMGLGVNAADSWQETADFRVITSFSSSTLVPNQMLTAKVAATNISTVPYSGKTDVLVIVGLYDSNNTMVNVSYISKGISYLGEETLSAGFKLPSNTTGYFARAFMWDGTDLKTSNMIPISNAVQIPDTNTTILPTATPTQSIRPTTTPSVVPTATSTPTVTPTVTPTSTMTGMRNITSLELVKDMKLGWNLGNTFDAGASETSWGNPRTTKAMIDKLKEAGFNTIRIPVTWGNHIGAAPNYTIDQAWLNRVEEVVNYVLSDNMYAIINIHHDNAWIVPTYANQSKTTDELTKVWTQIANRFKNYSDYLVFETMNEPRLVGTSYEWTGGTAESRDVINKYNLAAVNAIRNTGGNNKDRHVMVPTYAASASNVTVNDLIIPNNDSRVIVSLHMYSPYSFAMDVNGTSSWGSSSDKSSLDAELDAVYNKFVKNGRAVVIGEMGTINKNNLSSRVAHAEYFAKSARVRGLTPVWWDNGVSAQGAESYSIFNRNSLTFVFPDIAQAFVRGVGN